MFPGYVKAFQNRTRLTVRQKTRPLRAVSCLGIDEPERKLTDIHHQRRGGLTCLHVTDVEKTSTERGTVCCGAREESDHIKVQ